MVTFTSLECTVALIVEFIVALSWSPVGSILFSQHAYLDFMGKDVLTDVYVPMEHPVIMWQGSVDALLVLLEWAVSKVRTYNLLIGQMTITKTTDLPKLGWISVYWNIRLIRTVYLNSTDFLA